MPLNVSQIKENVVANPPIVTQTSADTGMKNAFIASGIFHALLFILTLIGIPFIAKDPPLVITPITMELVDIADVTQTNRIASPKKEAPIEVEKPEAPAPKPESPKVDEETPPDLTPPEAPEPIEEVKKEEPKPKPPEKPKPEPKKEDKPKKDFDSLLKNLAPDAPETPSEKITENETANDSGQNALLSDKLTMSELDAFKYQLEPCWNVPAGIKYAENLAVEIRVTMNRDMTIASSKIIDTGRYNRDNAFRAAADSAMRSLRNPRCSPLKLPPNKYDQWKTIVINFDPRDML